MTKEQLQQQIKEVELDIFYLAMKDMWDRKDFERDDELHKKLKELQEALNDQHIHKSETQQRVD